MYALLSVLLVMADESAAELQFGRVVSLIGNASAVTGNATRRLAAGDRLYRGDVVMTAVESRAHLLFADRSVVSLGSSAELVLSKLEPAERPKISVKLVAGRVWARIQKFFGGGSAFTVETANAVAGVRGTSIFVGVDGKVTAVAVERGEGTVTDKDGHQTILPPMTQLTVDDSGVSDVGALDPAELGDMMAGFATGGSFNIEGASGRLSSTEQALSNSNSPASPEVTEPIATVPGSSDPAPVNIDPQQSNRDAEIRGTIEIVP